MSGRIEALPTGVVAYISLPINHWSEVHNKIEGELVELWRPKELHDVEVAEEEVEKEDKKDKEKKEEKKEDKKEKRKTNTLKRRRNNSDWLNKSTGAIAPVFLPCNESNQYLSEQESRFVIGTVRKE